MISVLIPTYNRSATLLESLQVYYKLRDHFYEIILVDDGSTDDTEKLVNSFISEHPEIKIKFISTSNSGPGRARNIGVKSVTTPIVLITGDDIIPTQVLFEEHVQTHKKFQNSSQIAVLGKTIWPMEFNVTPFMNYIQEYGLQFGYSLIQHENEVPFNFFYTSNISINTNLFKENKFNESFPYAAWEDTELGYRLCNNGLKIMYNEKALAYHNHMINLTSFCNRQIKCGYSSWIFSQLHPELNGFLKISESISEDPIWKNYYIFLLKIISAVSDKYLKRINLRDIDIIMEYYYKKGLIKYHQERMLVKQKSE